MLAEKSQFWFLKRKLVEVRTYRNIVVQMVNDEVVPTPHFLGGQVGKSQHQFDCIGESWDFLPHDAHLVLRDESVYALLPVE